MALYMYPYIWHIPCLVEYIDVGWDGPAGNMYSSVYDLAQLMMMIFRSDAEYDPAKSQVSVFTLVPQIVHMYIHCYAPCVCAVLVSIREETCMHIHTFSHANMYTYTVSSIYSTVCTQHTQMYLYSSTCLQMHIQ